MWILQSSMADIQKHDVHMKQRSSAVSEGFKNVQLGLSSEMKYETW